MKPRPLPDYAEEALLVTTSGLKGYEGSGEVVTIAWEELIETRLNGEYQIEVKVYHADQHSCEGQHRRAAIGAWAVTTVRGGACHAYDHDPELACWMTVGVCPLCCDMLCCAQNIPNYTRIVIDKMESTEHRIVDICEVIALKEDANDVIKAITAERERAKKEKEEKEEKEEKKVQDMDIDTAREELERDDLDEATQSAILARVDALETQGP